MVVMRSRFPGFFISLLAVLVLAACGAPQQEAAEEEAAGEVPAEAVRTAIADAIHAEGDMVMLEVPGRPGEGPLHMTFDHVHEGVDETPGGRYVACVDFRGADGTIYDVDYYVAREGDVFRIEDVVLHEVAGENVIPDSTRARLETEG